MDSSYILVYYHGVYAGLGRNTSVTHTLHPPIRHTQQPTYTHPPVTNNQTTPHPLQDVSTDEGIFVTPVSTPYTPPIHPTPTYTLYSHPTYPHTISTPTTLYSPAAKRHLIPSQVYVLVKEQFCPHSLHPISHPTHTLYSLHPHTLYSPTAKRHLIPSQVYVLVREHVCHPYTPHPHTLPPPTHTTPTLYSPAAK